MLTARTLATAGCPHRYNLASAGRLIYSACKRAYKVKNQVQFYCSWFFPLLTLARCGQA
jgi:hypothetical protein